MLLRCDVELLACGQVALEDDLIRVYDVFTSPAQRSRGLASLLCRHMLCQAREQGAQTACLQVDADNAAARSLHQQLGFRDPCAYRYRALDLALE